MRIQLTKKCGVAVLALLFIISLLALLPKESLQQANAASVYPGTNYTFTGASSPYYGAPSFEDKLYTMDSYAKTGEDKLTWTDGINLTFGGAASGNTFTYVKPVDISGATMTEPFFRILVDPTGNWQQSQIYIYVDLIDYNNPNNFLRVRFNLQDDGGGKPRSYVMAGAPNSNGKLVGKLYLSTTLPYQLAVSTSEKGGTYSSTDVTGLTSSLYYPLSFSYDNATKSIYTTIIDRPYTNSASSHRNIVAKLDSTDFFTDGKLWEGFSSDFVKVRVTTGYVYTTPRAMTITKIGNEDLSGASLSAQFTEGATEEENAIAVSVPNALQDNEYQLWIYEKNRTYSGDVEVDKQESWCWKLANAYGEDDEGVMTATVGDGSNYLYNDAYRLFVRIRSLTDGNIKDIYLSATQADVGQLAFASLSVNGVYGKELYIINDDSLAVIQAAVNIDGAAYSIALADDPLTVIESNATGEFKLNLSSAPFNALSGECAIRLEVTKGSQGIAQDFNVYIVRKPDNAVEITELSYEAGEDIRNIEYTLVMKYLDDTIDITQGNWEEREDDFSLAFLSEYKLIELTAENHTKSIDYDANLVTYKISIDYEGYGIKYVAAYAGTQQNYTDWAAIYCHGAVRPNTSATITANGDETNIITFTKVEGMSVEFNVSQAQINGSTANLQYSWLTEDAGGWKIIRSYSENSKFVWTPYFAGTYGIVLHIKDASSTGNTYEIEKVVTVVINGIDNLSDDENLSILVENGKGVDITNNIGESGTPVLFKATYNGSEKVLYRYAVLSNNKTLYYLNTFNTSGEVWFVPNKGDTYTIVVRAIAYINFGYKDVSKTITFIVE